MSNEIAIENEIKAGKNWLSSIAAIGVCLVSIVVSFQFFVPSKAEVEADTKAIADLQKDHDTVVKMAADVDYIKKWIDRQDMLSGRTPRQKDN